MEAPFVVVERAPRPQRFGFRSYCGATRIGSVPGELARAESANRARHRPIGRVANRPTGALIGRLARC